MVDERRAHLASCWLNMRFAKTRVLLLQRAAPHTWLVLRQRRARRDREREGRRRDAAHDELQRQDRLRLRLDAHGRDLRLPAPARDAR